MDPVATVRIDADLLIPGRGRPIADGSVLLTGDRISFAGPRVAAPPTPGSPIRVPVVMPGLWDAHAHFYGMPAPDLVTAATSRPAQLVGRATRDLAATLAGGVTSVRELGGFGAQLAPLLADGTLAGPRVHGAGRALSMSGGHGDIHSLPYEFVRTLEDDAQFGIMCDGVADCLRAVRLNLRDGARVIKVMASGGVLSEVDDPVHQQFSDEELRAIVEEAARAEIVVAAHCHGKPGIMAALRAGVRTIEHGTYLDEEAIDVMLETGALFVPTRFIVQNLRAMRDRLPPYAVAKAEPVIEAHTAALALAIEAGVPIAAGCDIFVPDQYGSNGAEVRHLVEAGMDPLAAVEAATANGPLTLGPRAPRSGQLAEGFDADVIALAADPLADPSAWGDPSRVTHVWLGGRLVKGPVEPARHSIADHGAL